MLVTLTGTLEHLDPSSGLCWIGLGSPTSRVVMEAHVPASTSAQIASLAADAVVTLHTHLEFAPQGPVGALRPKLYGFSHPLDRQFFLRLITVKGVGASVALDMMAAPTAMIAAAIQAGDEAYLKKLPRIGGSKAKLLVAELKGKVAVFESGDAGPARPGRVIDAVPLDPIGASVLAILTAQLDLDAKEARTLLDRARTAHPDATEVETLLTAVFAVRG